MAVEHGARNSGAPTWRTLPAPPAQLRLLVQWLELPASVDVRSWALRVLSGPWFRQVVVHGDYQQRVSKRRQVDYRPKSLAASFKESALARIALRAANAKMRLRPSANALSTRASLASGGSQKNRSSASLVSEQRTSRPPIEIGNTTAVPSPVRTISETLVESIMHPCFIR